MSDMSHVHSTAPLISETSFRLLRLSEHPSQSWLNDDENPISCTLYEANLNDQPDFVALSYMWGDDPESRTIIVNGRSFRIKENLWHFFQQMRRVQQSHASHKDPRECASHSLPLWVDAICIDQSYICERNHQVSIMGEIYSGAHLVITWLGCGDENLLRGVQHLANYEPGENLGTTLASKETCADICQVFLHPYWRRAWVLQEFLLARHIHVWCGPLVVIEKMSPYRSSEIVRILNVGSDMPELLHTILLLCRRQLHDVELATDTRPPYKNILEPSEELKILLLLSRNSGCHDPRDRVFGILSLLSPKQRRQLSIRPDYAKTTEELLRDVSTQLWLHVANYDAEKHNVYHDLLVASLRVDAEICEASEIQRLHPAPAEV